MMTDKHVGELRFFVDSSGVVWFGDGKGKAQSSNLPPAEFAKKFCTKGSKFRLLGVPSNASLITSLYQLLLESNTTHILEIGTPLFCRTMQLTDPCDVIASMGRLDGISASLGGWHVALPYDYTIYRLVSAVIYKQGSRQGLLEQHPAFPAISFLANHNRVEAENLLALIIDPRWYVDWSRPGRTAKLRSYLGLRTPVIAAAWNCDNSSADEFGVFFYRAWQLLDTWTGGRREPPAYPELDCPNNFLWRRYCEFADPVRGAMRASAFFLLYLRGVWLDSISTQELFVPEYFFVRRGDEVAAVDQDGTTARAFREHVKSFQVGQS